MRRLFLLLVILSLAQLALAQQPTNQAQTAGATTATAASGVQKVGITDSLANAVSAFPATFLRTTDEPRQVFYDPFDGALDTTNRWTAPTVTSPGVIAANVTGTMTMGTGAGVSGWSKLTSQNTFTLSVPAWTGYSFAIALNDGNSPNANALRYWGSGSIPATPTVTVPITDGVGFEMSGAKMYAVVYAGGTRTAVQDLSAATGNSTQPTDTANHRYVIYVRTDKAYWYIDGITSANLVATSNFQSPQVQTLAETFVAVGNSSNAANSTIACTGAVVWDTGKNSTQLSDGTFPWRKATISAAGNLQTSVASALPAGSNNIGSMLPLGSAAVNASDAAWTSATSLNAAATVISNTSSYNSVLVTLVQGTTLTGGVVTFEQSIDNSTYTTVQGVQLGTTVIAGPTYTLVASTNVSFLFPVNAPYFRVRLSTVISGTGTVTVQHASQVFPLAALLAGTETLAAGSAVIGAVTESGTWNVGINNWGGSALGTPTNFGTTPGSVIAASANASLFIGTVASVASASGVQKVGISGNAAATLDAATNGAIPTNQLWTVATPTTAAGAALSVTSLSTSTTTTGTNIKSTAGNLYGVFAINGVASTCWLQFMNSGAGGTLGTAAIVSFPLPASTTQPIWIPLPFPIAFSTGIAIGTSTLVNGSVACGTATAVMVQYK